MFVGYRLKFLILFFKENKNTKSLKQNIRSG